MKTILRHKFLTAVLMVVVSGLSASALAAKDDSTTSKQKVNIQADEITFPGQSIVHLRGSTQLIQGNHRVYADQLIFNKRLQTIEFRGLVKIESSSGDVVRTPVLFYDLNKETAVTGAAEFELTTRDSNIADESNLFANACGTAERIEFKEGSISRMKSAKIATCEG